MSEQTEQTEQTEQQASTHMACRSAREGGGHCPISARFDGNY